MATKKRTPMTEVMHAIRRADGDAMGDYSFIVVDGPGDWQPAIDDAECAEDRVDYELVRMDLTVLGTRTFGPDKPACDSYEGERGPAHEWWEVVIVSQGEDTWPARDARMASRDTEVDAQLEIAGLPEVFVFYDGMGAHEVRRSQLSVVHHEMPGRWPDCGRCERGYWSHVKVEV